MTMFRQFVAFVLVGALTAPAAWSKPADVVGITLSSQGAQDRGESLTTGSTVFSGDGISVDAKGDATIALTGGGRVDVEANSSAILTRTQSGVQMVLQHGSASFRSEPDSTVTVLMADATIHAVAGNSGAGVVMIESPDSAVVTADKSALEITTAHDSRTLFVPEGAAARITLVAERQDGGQTTGSNAPVPPVKTPGINSLSTGTKIAIAVLLLGGLTAGGLAIAHNEHKVTNVINEVSPFQLK